MARMHGQVRDWADEHQIVGVNAWGIIAAKADLASIKDPVSQDQCS